MRCTAQKAFLDVTVSRLCVALLHAKTDGIAEGFKVDLIDGHPGKITKSSKVKCSEQTLVFLVTTNLDPGSRRILATLLQFANLENNEMIVLAFLTSPSQHFGHLHFDTMAHSNNIHTTLFWF